jgi:hypothetical protein
MKNGSAGAFSPEDIGREYEANIQVYFQRENIHIIFCARIDSHRIARVIRYKM